MKIYRSGNTIVDTLGQMHFTGNIIPDNWYRHLRYENGKPNINAIHILAEIVYWYRPTEIRDEVTGNVKFMKKFADKDYLQKSYDQLSDKFGFTRRQVKTAVIYLENRNLVKRHFRNIVSSSGLRLQNVMYIELIPDQLQKITYSFDDDNNIEQSSMYPGGYMDVHTRVHGCTQMDTQIDSDGDIQQHTYTQNTTEDNTKTPSDQSAKEAEYYKSIEMRVQEQIDVESLYMVYPHNKEIIDGIVTIVTDVLTTRQKYIRIGSENKPSEIVKTQFLKLNYGMVELLVCSLLKSARKISRPDNYLLTSLYKATLYSDLMIENDVHTDR